MKMKALDGLRLGWSVMPVKPNKKPCLFEWKPYQSTKPDKDILAEWRRKYKPSGWAVVTGRISGVFVLDFDGEAGVETMQSLALQPHVRTPSGGYHVYFEHPGIAVKTMTAKASSWLGEHYPGTDVRGDGGYAVFCGRSSDGRYEWLRDPEPEPFTVLPGDLAAFICPGKPPSESFADRLLREAVAQSAGGRNETGFQLACQLRDNTLTRAEAEAVMLRYQRSVPDTNSKGRPEPYTVQEAMASLDQAYDSPPREPSVATVEITHGDRPLGQAEGAENDEDLPITAQAWPDPLTSDAYYGLAGDLVRELEPHTEADPAALLSSFFVAFGNVIGRTAHFVAEADKHYMNLFVVQVGTSSKGRKGVSFGRIKQMLGELDGDWKSFHIQSGLSSGEGVIWAVRDPIEKQTAMKEGGKIVGYQTEITDPGVADKRLLCMEGEFAGVLRVLGREGNTLSAIIRNAWDTGELVSMTKNSPARATGAHISIVGHITKDELLRYLESTEAANGFGNRFLWVCVRRSKCLPEGGRPDQSRLSQIGDRLRQCIQFARSTGAMVRDDAARALWHEVYPELSEGKTGLLGAMIARAEAQVMRLACIYALLDCSATVRVEHLRAALAVWRYCEDSARFIFGESLGDPMADEIMGLLRQNPEGLTRWQISKHFGRNKASAAITRALQALAERGMVRRFKEQSGGGRPAERWLANSPLTASPYEENEVDEATPEDEPLSSLTSFSSYADTAESRDQDGEEWEDL